MCEFLEVSSVYRLGFRVWGLGLRVQDEQLEAVYHLIFDSKGNNQNRFLSQYSVPRMPTRVPLLGGFCKMGFPSHIPKMLYVSFYLYRDPPKNEPPTPVNLNLYCIYRYIYIYRDPTPPSPPPHQKKRATNSCKPKPNAFFDKLYPRLFGGAAEGKEGQGHFCGLRFRV